MYNLIVTADSDAWTGKRYSFPVSRLGEYTAEPLKKRYRQLNEQSIAELTSFPALFAYEERCQRPARVGRVIKIALVSGPDIRFEYVLSPKLEPVSPETLSALAWELDINAWELNRTHWAIKDIDLVALLFEHGLVKREAHAIESGALPSAPVTAPPQLLVSPTVFAVPSESRNPSLAAVMMPLNAEFANVYNAVQLAATRAGLECQRADDLWENSTIMQDIFSLIYRSAVVVVDLSGLNPNVLYETGVAHTLGRPVVPIANSVNALPFDLAHHRTLAYLPNQQGLQELAERLQRKLRQFVMGQPRNGA